MRLGLRPSGEGEAEPFEGRDECVGALFGCRLKLAATMGIEVDPFGAKEGFGGVDPVLCVHDCDRSKARIAGEEAW